MAAIARLRAFASALLLLSGLRTAAQTLVHRTIDVHAQRVELREALGLIARDARFKLSYDATAINGDSVVDVHAQGTAEDALRGLLGSGFAFKESGEHVILLDRRHAHEQVTLRGVVLDGATRAPLPGASVYAVAAGEATTTNTEGRFTLALDGARTAFAVRIGRAQYNDTVVFASGDGTLGTVALRPRERLAYLEPVCAFERCAVEDLGVARLLVPGPQMDQAANLDLTERRAFQASVWPSWGTNRGISGAVVNRASFNLIAGYARGLEGGEVGGAVNMERNAVKGFQVAGLANLVGGSTNGLQVAGGLNHTMRTLQGLQIAGFGNTVWDTLSGVQVAGGANVVKGGMRGVQVGGGANVALRSVDGLQVAGAVNVAVQDVRRTQVSGAFNYGRNVEGAQVSGGFNVARGTVGGGQVAGAFNYARDVTGGQVSGGFNVALDTVRGGQVGVCNIARVVRGCQMGILNFSDTITGGSVGIFSFAWRGYHRFDAVTTDVFPLSLRFRTGTRLFHNILGFSPALANGRWGVLYGFGTEPRLSDRLFLDIDLTAEQVIEQPTWVDAWNMLQRLDLRLGYRPCRAVTLTAGPALNLLATDWRDAGTGEYLSRVAPAAPTDPWHDDTTRYSLWWGWSAALGVVF